MLDVRRARTCTHIAPTDPHELHISSLHMNAARRPVPPAAIYYRARCLVQFTYDYADAPGSAPTYASAVREGETGRKSRERRKEKGVGSLALGCDRIRLDRFAVFRSRSAVAKRRDALQTHCKFSEYFDKGTPFLLMLYKSSSNFD